jgi:hypothetical protein
LKVVSPREPSVAERSFETSLDVGFAGGAASTNGAGIERDASESAATTEVRLRDVFASMVAPKKEGPPYPIERIFTKP